MTDRSRLSVVLLAFLPVTAAADLLHWGESVIFFVAIAAIIPLAVWLSTATEALSISLGPLVGGLLSALFGNATELIIALTALRAGLVDVVKASITGTVMGNLLLVIGLAMLTGGIGRIEQRFQPVLARVNGAAMTLAVLSILLPSLRAMGDSASGHANESFSIFVAWVLLIVYGLTLLFSLGTHRTLYAVAEANVGEASSHEHGEVEAAPSRPLLLPWLAVLTGCTLGLAYASEQFVGVVEPVTNRVGLTPIFTGVILLPQLGGISDYFSAVTMARKDKMDLSMSVALNSTLLFALLVVPMLVLVGPLLGHPIDLSFNVYELVAIFTAVVVSNFVSLDGRSDWLGGVLLVAAYVILAAGFFFEAGSIP